MKKIISLLVACATLLTTFCAKAENHFENLSTEQGYDYVYISPEMVKAMSSSQLRTDDVHGNTYNLSFSDLNEVEILSTATKGTDVHLWQIIRGIIKQKGLKTLTCTKEGYRRFDMIGKVDDSNVLTHLMLIVQNGGNNVSVTYMTGRIPLENMSKGL